MSISLLGESMVKMFNGKSSTSPNQNAEEHLSESMSSEYQILTAPPSNEMGTYSHLNDIHLSISRASFDLHPDEIQEQLRNLLKENVELKETLQHNNVAMNEQFNRLLAWREEVLGVQQQHKQKFEETRTLVYNLRKENAELLNQLHQLESAKKEQETVKTENSVLKKHIETLEQANDTIKKENDRLSVVELQFKKDFATLISNHESMKTKLNNIVMEKQELMALNNELQSKLANHQPESSYQDIRTTYKNEDPSFVMLPLGQQLSNDLTVTKEKQSISELLLLLHTEQDKLSFVTKKLAEEQKKNVFMTKQITDLKKQLKIPSLAVQRQGINFLDELKESEMKFSMANNYFERYKEHCDSLENWLETCQGHLQVTAPEGDTLIGKLKIEVCNLKQTLLEQQALNQEDKKNLIEARHQFETLLKDYQKLLKSWENFEQEQINKGQQSEAYYEIQTRTLKEQIDNLTAKLVGHEEDLSVKTDELQHMKVHREMTIQELQKIPILQAQVDLYQTDFRLEREQCEKYKRERDRALIENRDMQKRIKNLDEELQGLRSNRRMVINQSPGRQTIYSSPGFPYHQALSSDSSANRETGNNLGAISRTITPGARMSTTTRSSSCSGGVGSVRLNLKELHLNQRSSKNEQRVPLSPDDNLYFCPKCNLGFTEFQPLENHVNDCLDNDDPFVN